jgi:hypothetical protein
MNLLKGIIVFLGGAMLICSATLTTKTDTQKGIAMSLTVREDVDLLEADWWYYYGNNPNPEDLLDPRYVPMLQQGAITANLPTDYDGYVLVFNEPDLQEWAMYSPQEAYDQWLVLRELYPNIVFGNISHLGMWWIEEFMVLCDADCPELWGIHCYPWNDWEFCEDFLVTVHNTVGTNMWLTETQATPDGNPALLLDIIKWAGETPWIERYAVFGNRDMSGEVWWPPSWGDVALVDDDGLTRLGQMYKDEAFKIFIPAVYN